MAKSYMYFLESYGNEQLRQRTSKNRNGRYPHNPQQVQLPHHSLHKQQFQQPGYAEQFGNRSLLRSAILNNSTIIDKNGVPNVTSRYPPQFKRNDMGNPNSTLGRTRAVNNGKQQMDETTAGLGLLSNDTRHYMNNLNNSMLLGEVYPNYNNGGNYGKGSMLYSDGDDDDEEYAGADANADYGGETEGNGNSDGGVLGLINQIYKHKDGVK
ncbi:unnamed protein product [Ambrosiozyma monospora]|uniref:Unnamed protein product n=1 Tax=Ambrosiozyma monospora TaxID=43982 RepID=A0ACB5T7Y1_AMBMO|nr:unnamed protein product [Ambrosiozyma monospora]